MSKNVDRSLRILTEIVLYVFFSHSYISGIQYLLFAGVGVEYE